MRNDGRRGSRPGGTRRTEQGTGNFTGRTGGKPYRSAQKEQGQYRGEGARSGRPAGEGQYRSDYNPRQAKPAGSARPAGPARPAGDGQYRNDYSSRQARPARPEGEEQYRRDYSPRPAKPVRDGQYKKEYGPRPARPAGEGQYRNEHTPRPPRPAGEDQYRRDAKSAHTRVEAEAPVAQERSTVPAENLLVGRNPIREALKAGRSFESLYVQKGELNGSAREIVRMAKEKRVMVREVDRRALEAMSPGHQGLVAVVSAHEYSTVEDILGSAQEKGEEPLLVILDGITDPHNMGAIARTAECCGAHGLILCERRAVGMTPGAAKAAAGAFEYLPVARVPNITRLIEQLKQKNIFVFAADQDAKDDYSKTDLTGAVAIVIGDEGEGVSRLALSKCDGTLRIPIRGQIQSLNASVAAGVLLYEALRQRIT